MKFMTDTADLLEAVLHAQKAVAQRSSMQLLEGILLEASGGQVRLVGYDMEIGIQAVIPADVSEPGIIVVDSRMLGDIVRKLPDPLVRFETLAGDKEIVQIRSGRAFFSVNYRAADSYPVLPEVARENRLVLPQRALQSLIARTVFACATDESRGSLSGCLLESTPDMALMVAIDGFRLALARHHRDTEDENSEAYAVRSFLIPGKAMRELQQILGDGDVEIFTSENHILFEFGTSRLVSRLMKDDFLNYQGIIPSNELSLITVNKEALLSTIERSMLLLSASDQTRSPVRFSTHGDDNLEVYMVTSRGTLDEQVKIQLIGDDIDCSFNPRYIVEALRVIPDERINMAFKGNVGPGVLRPLEGDAFAYVILPLRP
ncbi:MAG: DNA polymerase III subunit beta [Bacillota bacterium]|nr:DNA polymerase III subunit beta [Bacillota bacterium]